MTDERNLPADAADDPALDRHLAGLPALVPGSAFMERVLRRVRVPYPRWFLRTRAWAKGWVSGPRGWILLASFSVATAACWGLGIAVALHFNVLSLVALARLASPTWTAFATAAGVTLDTVSAWLFGALAATGLQLQVLVTGSLGIVALSAVGLWRLARTPAHMRNVSHVAR